MQNEKGQTTHGQGEMVKIPLLPYNVDKRVLMTWDQLQGHDATIVGIQILQCFL